MRERLREVPGQPSSRGVVFLGEKAYLAAVYLASDAARAGHDDLADDFRTRALGAGAVAGAVALAGLVVARYLASAAVAAIVVGWALAQRPELLPGLTVEQAAAGRPALLATIVGVGVGAAVLVPALILLFGLVLRGRFDRESAGADIERRAVGVAPRRRTLGSLTVLALTIGLPLTLIPAGGPIQAVGVVALLAFVALGSAALGSTAAAATARDEEQ